MYIKTNPELNAKGLYSTKSYLKDEIVFTLAGKIYDYPTRETIYIGHNKHIYDEFGIFMNHSFTPSTRIDGYNVVALRDIKCNDEITFNYNDSELKMANPFYVNDILVDGNNNNVKEKL